jgi:N-acetylmuramoyl-L-alanine amidase
MAERKKVVVVLDPGHGGSAPADGSAANNAVGPNGLLEKDLTLAVAQQAAEHLRRLGFETLLTRESDTNVALRDRALKAREAGADVFVSLHLNGHSDARVDGTEAYVSPAARDRDRALAQSLLSAVSMTAGVPSRGIGQEPFEVLKGESHVPATSVCLLEMAYLTNAAQARRFESPGYVSQVGMGVAQGVMGYSTRLMTSRTVEAALEAGTDETLVYDQEKDHADPPNFPINFPEPGKGDDRHVFTIPDGLRFTRWDVEVLQSSPFAGYNVAVMPAPGAEGRQQIRVSWWYPMYGRMRYRLRVYASATGEVGAGAPIVYEAPGWQEQVNNRLTQGLPVEVALRGDRAKLVYDTVRTAHPEAISAPVAAALIAGVDDAIIIAVIGLAIVIVISIVIALGMAVLGYTLTQAMNNGYDVKDTKYKAAAGQGDTRQEHEMVFNLTKRLPDVQGATGG